MWCGGRKGERIEDYKFTVILGDILSHFLLSSTFRLSPAVFCNGFSLLEQGSNQLSSITCNYVFFNLDDRFFPSLLISPSLRCTNPSPKLEQSRPGHVPSILGSCVPDMDDLIHLRRGLLRGCSGPWWPGLGLHSNGT